MGIFRREIWQILKLTLAIQGDDILLDGAGEDLTSNFEDTGHSGVSSQIPLIP